MHSVVGTAANVADVTQVDKLLHEGVSVRPPACPLTFWFKPVSIFGLAILTTFI